MTANLVFRVLIYILTKIEHLQLKNQQTLAAVLSIYLMFGYFIQVDFEEVHSYKSKKERSFYSLQGNFNSNTEIEMMASTCGKRSPVLFCKARGFATKVAVEFSELSS